MSFLVLVVDDRGQGLENLLAYLPSSCPSFRDGAIAGPEVIRVGLVGCGGRGSGAVEQCLRAGALASPQVNVRLVALGGPCGAPSAGFGGYPSGWVD